jgi:hypothetical protein
MNDEFINRCRLFIEIDRCFIKGPYRGVLLSIMGLDAYNKLFFGSICYC